MRQGPHVKRSRGRGHGQGGGGQGGGGQGGNPNGGGGNNGGNRNRQMPLRHQTFDSNGPDVRVRGNAFQVFEKYLALARDASAAGDRIAAENYYQHAEHYYRIINANNEGQPYQPQHQREQMFDGEQPETADGASVTPTGANAQAGGPANGQPNGHSNGQANGHAADGDEGAIMISTVPPVPEPSAN